MRTDSLSWEWFGSGSGSVFGNRCKGGLGIQVGYVAGRWGVWSVGTGITYRLIRTGISPHHRKYHESIQPYTFSNRPSVLVLNTLGTLNFENDVHGAEEEIDRTSR